MVTGLTTRRQELDNFLMNKVETEALKEQILVLKKELLVKDSDLKLYKARFEEAAATLNKLSGHMEDQIKILQMIQKQMVPTEFPHIPGFEFSFKFVPSKISGGDYFDVFEHENKSRFGLILSSASGYGASALLLSLLLRLSGSMKAKKSSDPSEVMKTISEQLRETLTGENNCHIFYGQVERGTQELGYVVAGDILVLHYDYLGNKLNRLSKTCEAFSNKNTMGPKTNKIQLNPRDRLIVCSKGFNEIQKDGEPFGEERLYRTVLSVISKDVHEVRNEVVFQIKKYLNETELPRDFTVLAVEVKDRVIKLARDI